MTRRFIPKVVTANLLREGDVVYLTADDRWSPHLHDAEMVEDEAHANLRLAQGSAQKLLIVGAYLADVKPGPNGPEPTHFREEFRTRGPSNYHHGKQADYAG